METQTIKLGTTLKNILFKSDQRPRNGWLGPFLNKKQSLAVFLTTVLSFQSFNASASLQAGIAAHQNSHSQQADELIDDLFSRDSYRID